MLSATKLYKVASADIVPYVWTLLYQTCLVLNIPTHMEGKDLNILIAGSKKHGGSQIQEYKAAMNKNQIHAPLNKSQC